MRCLTNRLGTDKKSGQVLKHLALWWNKLPDSLFWLPPTAKRVKTAPLLGKGIFCLQGFALRCFARGVLGRIGLQSRDRVDG